MYIKKGSGRRMALHLTKNERNFNDTLNNMAGTSNVKYSSVWPMHVTDGEAYLQHNRHDVAKKFAFELLHGRVPNDAHLSSGDTHLSPKQRLALSFLHQSKPEHFEAALDMCYESNALPTTARPLLDDRFDVHEVFLEPQLDDRPSDAEQPGLDDAHAVPTATTSAGHAAVMQLEQPETATLSAMNDETTAPIDVSDVHMQEKEVTSTPTRTISLNDPKGSKGLSLHKSKKQRKK